MSECLLNGQFPKGAVVIYFMLFYYTGIPYTLSRSGRPAIFTRDPDANALEFTQVDA